MTLQMRSPANLAGLRALPEGARQGYRAPRVSDGCSVLLLSRHTAAARDRGDGLGRGVEVVAVALAFSYVGQIEGHRGRAAERTGLGVTRRARRCRAVAIVTRET